jgi:hypothetical protein
MNLMPLQHQILLYQNLSSQGEMHVVVSLGGLIEADRIPKETNNGVTMEVQSCHVVLFLNSALKIVMKNESRWSKRQPGPE